MIRRAFALLSSANGSAATKAASRHRGVVVKFNERKRFGFISPAMGGPDVFVHLRDVRRDDSRKPTRPEPGDHVEYEVRTQRGEDRGVAVDVEVLTGR